MLVYNLKLKTKWIKILRSHKGRQPWSDLERKRSQSHQCCISNLQRHITDFSFLSFYLFGASIYYSTRGDLLLCIASGLVHILSCSNTHSLSSSDLSSPTYPLCGQLQRLSEHLGCLFNRYQCPLSVTPESICSAPQCTLVT